MSYAQVAAKRPKQAKAYAKLSTKLNPEANFTPKNVSQAYSGSTAAHIEYQSVPASSWVSANHQGYYWAQPDGTGWTAYHAAMEPQNLGMTCAAQATTIAQLEQDKLDLAAELKQARIDHAATSSALQQAVSDTSRDYRSRVELQVENATLRSQVKSLTRTNSEQSNTIQEQAMFIEMQHQQMAAHYPSGTGQYAEGWTFPANQQPMTYHDGSYFVNGSFGSGMWQ